MNTIDNCKLMNSYIRRLLQLSLCDYLLIARIIKPNIIEENNDVTEITCGNKKMTIVKVRGVIEDFASRCIQLNPFSNDYNTITDPLDKNKNDEDITFLKIDESNERELTWFYHNKYTTKKYTHRLSKMPDIEDSEYHIE